MFQPRYPFTRLPLAKGVMVSKNTEVANKGKQPMVEDIIDLSPAKEEIIVQRKGKEKFIEKTEVHLLKEKLREAMLEVIETKLELEEAKLDRKMVDEFKEKVNKQINHYDESLTNANKLLKRTLPLRRVMKHTRKRNIWLQTERKKLKGRVKELE